MCSDADMLLLKVTPRTFSVVSRSTSGSSGGDEIETNEQNELRFNVFQQVS